MNEQLHKKLLFELQKLNSRKTDLALQISECLSRKLNMERDADLGRHKRLDHGGSWDDKGYSRDRRERDKELRELRAEYVEVNEQMIVLETELSSIHNQLSNGQIISAV
jgi:hypothetical protein